MSTTKGAPDAFTTTLAAVLRESIRDQHRKFPKLRDFKAALRERAHLSDDTAERILNGRTSIRADYLFHMAALLDTRASTILVEVEDRLAAAPIGDDPFTQPDAAVTGALPQQRESDPRTDEHLAKLSGLVQSHGDAIQTKGGSDQAPAIESPPTPGRPHAI